MGSQDPRKERAALTTAAFRKAKARAKEAARKAFTGGFITGAVVIGILGTGALFWQAIEHKREVYEIYHEESRECYEIRKNNGLLHKENANLLSLYNKARKVK
jgi:hypothetical protein